MICSYCKSQSFALPLHPERNLMKQTLAIFILSLFALHLRAQQMISVIDIDTRQPVAQAFFIQEGDTIAYTSSQGMALVPTSFASNARWKGLKRFTSSATKTKSYQRNSCMKKAARLYLQRKAVAWLLA